jgi:hypothetical protein
MHGLVERRDSSVHGTATTSAPDHSRDSPTELPHARTDGGTPSRTVDMRSSRRALGGRGNAVRRASLSREMNVLGSRSVRVGDVSTHPDRRIGRGPDLA